MPWVEFTCTGTDFESRIASAMISNGWERCGTTNWVKPTWSPRCVRQRIIFLPSTRVYAEISGTAFQYTIYEPELREYFDTSANTGAGAGWVGWGNPVYWAGATRNETIREYTFEGWIDEYSLIGVVKPDPTMLNAISFVIWVGMVRCYDRTNRLMALDAMPSTNSRRAGQRLIYADDTLGYFFGFTCGGIGVSTFDKVARLSKVYVLRGGTSASIVPSYMNIIGELTNPAGVPYVLASLALGVEAYGDIVELQIGDTTYKYRLVNPVPSPTQMIFALARFDGFDVTYAPSQTTGSKWMYLWVRYE